MVSELTDLGLRPKVVHWKVSAQNAVIPPPNLGFFLNSQDIPMVVDRLADIPAVMVVLEDDPVLTHAVDPRRAQWDRYVVVKWMPPRPHAVGIVDVDSSEFVTLMDFDQLSNGAVLRADQRFIENLVESYQFAANEYNRLAEEVRNVMEARTELVH